MSDEYDETWRTWIGLRMVRGVGPVVYQGLLNAFGDPARVFAASLSTLECAGVRDDVARAIRGFRDWSAVDEQLQRLKRCGARLLTWNDALYPAQLRHIHDPPPFLFMLGELEARDAQAIAVVGTRQPSAYAIRMARELAEGLVAYGVTVVSGLARGTDAAAHWGTLKANGRTLAVLGSGVDVIYPGEHRGLARSIAGSGAVLSELAMGTQPDAENFPSRNRIVSGLSLGVVVIEAAEKSGSLITAFMAAEQGREVFAVPGAVGQRTAGCHRLLRQGAKLTERVEDVLEELLPRLLEQRTKPSGPVLSAVEQAVVAAIGSETTHVDTIMGRCRLGVPVVLEALLTLELKGVVEQVAGKRFTVLKVDESPSLAKEGR